MRAILTAGRAGGNPQLLPLLDGIRVARVGPGRRNVVERCFNRPGQFRDLATRQAKRVACYQAELAITAIILWPR